MGEMNRSRRPMAPAQMKMPIIGVHIILQSYTSHSCHAPSFDRRMSIFQPAIKLLTFYSENYFRKLFKNYWKLFHVEGIWTFPQHWKTYSFSSKWIASCTIRGAAGTGGSEQQLDHWRHGQCAEQLIDTRLPELAALLRRHGGHQVFVGTLPVRQLHHRRDGSQVTPAGALHDRQSEDEVGGTGGGGVQLSETYVDSYYIGREEQTSRQTVRQWDNETSDRGEIVIWWDGETVRRWDSEMMRQWDGGTLRASYGESVFTWHNAV